MLSPPTDLMNIQLNAEPAPNVLAVHEAGHLLVGLLIGRKLTCVSLDYIESQRGCFWSTEEDHHQPDEFQNILCCLAGPRAQTEITPDSLLPEKLILFKKQIVQPSLTPRTIPSDVYDYTGWESDVRAVYEYLCYPEAPVLGLQSTPVNRSDVVRRAESSLLAFFKIALAQDATKRLALNLLQNRRLDRASAEAAFNEVCSPELSSAAECLSWSGPSCCVPGVIK